MLDIKRNLTTMTDFYELTMSNGYFEQGYKDKIAVFDMFFRRVPDGGGYAIMAGLQQFIDAVDNLRFTEADITYLRGTGMFSEPFLDYLAHFELHCNIWAIEEGVLSGKDQADGSKLLCPQDTCTRAELATMLMRMDNEGKL